ncbi:unnamed protein product [Ectocarpus sp. 4 AP-2014]
MITEETILQHCRTLLLETLFTKYVPHASSAQAFDLATAQQRRHEHMLRVQTDINATQSRTPVVLCGPPVPLSCYLSLPRGGVARFLVVVPKRGVCAGEVDDWPLGLPPRVDMLKRPFPGDGTYPACSLRQAAFVWRGDDM